MNKTKQPIVEVSRNQLTLYRGTIMKSAAATLLGSILLLTIVAPAHAEVTSSGQTTPPIYNPPVYTQNQDSNSPNFNLSGVVTGVITDILSPRHRGAEIDAHARIEIAKIQEQGNTERAKITAEANKTIDRVAPILTQWGVSRVSCTPGGVFINGLSSDTVCINPTAPIPAGHYNYSPERQALVRINTDRAPAPAPAVTITKTINSQPGF